MLKICESIVLDVRLAWTILFVKRKEKNIASLEQETLPIEVAFL
jgi:hypothetical protein